MGKTFKDSPKARKDKLPRMNGVKRKGGLKSLREMMKEDGE